MKFELKTDNENYLNTFKNFFKTLFCIALLVIFFDVTHKLRAISRNYKIDFYCRILTIEKSQSNFKKLSKLSKLKSKQKIWEFCRGVVN